MTLKRPESQLFASKWALAPAIVCTIKWPSRATLGAVDDEWPALRPENATYRHWKWSTIAGSERERFAALDPNGRIVGLWASAKPVVTLEEVQHYRLDYIEIYPPLCGKVALGASLMALVSLRASELKCEGVVLASLKESTSFYERLKGTPRSPRNWKYAAGTEPIVFEGPAFAQLLKVSDVLREDEEAS